MSYFAVIRDAGRAGTNGKGAFDQPGANDHAAFMNTLAGEGGGWRMTRGSSPGAL